jgi:hypothetical protein
LIVLASVSAGSVAAQSADVPPADPSVVSRADDLDRTCEELAEEASTLTERMGEAGQPTLFGRLGGLARTGAQLLPGGALVVAGADVLTGPGREGREAEAETTRYRWHYLNGLYLGRGCEPPPVTPQGPTQTPPETSPAAPPQAASPPATSPTASMTPPVVPRVSVIPPLAEPPPGAPTPEPAGVPPNTTHD